MAGTWTSDAGSVRLHQQAAENEQLVIKELRKLESNTRTGLSFAQYSDRLLTSTAEMDVALKDDPDQSFVKRVRRIQHIYREARDSWDEEIHDGTNDQSLLPKIWAEASERLDRLEQYANAGSATRANLDAEDKHADEVRVAEIRRDIRAETHKEALEAERETKNREKRRTDDEKRDADEQAQDAQREQAEKAVEQKRQADEIAAAKTEHGPPFRARRHFVPHQKCHGTNQGRSCGNHARNRGDAASEKPGRHAPRQSESKHPGN